MLSGLPHGWVGTICNLRSPEEEFPPVKSVVLMSLYAWDKAFNLQVDSSYFPYREVHTPKVPLENYQLYYEIMKNKAWIIVDYLKRKGLLKRAW